MTKVVTGKEKVSNAFVKFGSNSMTNDKVVASTSTKGSAAAFLVAT